jgi:hypothetical protein
MPVISSLPLYSSLPLLPGEDRSADNCLRVVLHKNGVDLNGNKVFPALTGDMSLAESKGLIKDFFNAYGLGLTVRSFERGDIRSMGNFLMHHSGKKHDIRVKFVGEDNRLHDGLIEGFNWETTKMTFAFPEDGELSRITLSQSGLKGILTSEVGRPTPGIILINGKRSAKTPTGPV